MRTDKVRRDRVFHGHNVRVYDLPVELGAYTLIIEGVGPTPGRTRWHVIVQVADPPEAPNELPTLLGFTVDGARVEASPGNIRVLEGATPVARVVFGRRGVERATELYRGSWRQLTEGVR